MRPELREVGSTYALAFAGTALLGLLATSVAPALGTTAGGLLGDVAGAATALLFFGLAAQRARREPGGPARFGIELGGLVEGPDAPQLGLFAVLRQSVLPALRETGFALLVAVVIFPPFLAAFWWWHAPTHALTWSPPADIASFALTQIVMVGVPEEAFFRGYVQTRLHDVWPPSRTLGGARLDPRALVLQAALFAVVHLAAEPRVEKLATFFPGLLFGWLRARRGGVGAAVVLHALSNVLAELLVRGWLL